MGPSLYKQCCKTALPSLDRIRAGRASGTEGNSSPNTRGGKQKLSGEMLRVCESTFRDLSAKYYKNNAG